ncbi:hypothetical protein [Agromyces protaetiae]|uniref:hypothetical protein n=1 Tax=Agromyces protaetiae TaxID=2509455 RepID=UPI0013E9ADB8|nr:hypothetical protein [Agromyces protaetiae]
MSLSGTYEILLLRDADEVRFAQNVERRRLALEREAFDRQADASRQAPTPGHPVRVSRAARWAAVRRLLRGTRPAL